MTGAQRLGQVLREQRERKAITLQQAAEDTRIRERFLAALESGDHGALPGAVYTKGFLRNYADYLDLDATELVALYTAERAAVPEPPRRFEPMRPVMRQGVLISPRVLLPFIVLGGVALFAAYFVYQFSAFATPPRIEVTQPAGDVVADSTAYTVKGRTAPDARVTVRVFPGPETFPDIRPAADGTFSVEIRLHPGANHVEVQVLDAAGKVSQISRSVYLAPALAASPSPSPDPEAPPRVAVEQPAQGATFTNSAVPISGRVERGVVSITVNGAPVAIGPDGRFQDSIPYPAGTHAVRFVARTAGGAEVTETRTVTVAFTSAVVTVRVQGGEAWLYVIVDGAPVPGTGRVYPSGAANTYSGRQVVVRTGNAGATTVTYNGQRQGSLGGDGQVVEKTYTFSGS